VIRRDEYRIQVETMIAAPPQTVWETLTEFPAYGSWHPVLLIDDAPAAPGTRLSGRITGGYTGERDFSAEILEADGPHRLVWEGGIPGVLTGRHILQLDPTGDGGTRYIESETWSGSAAEET